MTDPIDFPQRATNDASRPMPEPSEPLPAPTLLKVPERFQSVAEVLACAAKMDLPNVLVLSQLEDGRIVFLDDGMSVSQTNWLLDNMKMLLLMPERFQKTK